MAQRYSPLLDTTGLPANDLPRRSSLAGSDSDDSGSEVSYRDQLDIEPFHEKEDRRFQDEPSMEDDIGGGTGGQPRRVRISFFSCMLVKVVVQLSVQAPS